MLVFSFLTPAGHPRGPVVLVLVLDMENVERMKQSDPFDLKLSQIPGSALVATRARNVDLVIAYEDDTAMIADFQKRQDISGLMHWLERGRVIRPGDCAPIEKLRTGSGA